MTHFSTAVVIGGGTMGSGIAAHLANSGMTVTLLDITTDYAQAGIDRQLATGGFMDPAFASRVTPGNLEADTDRLSDAEWIIEAVIEDRDVKQDVYRRIEQHRPPDAFVSSNTSTISLHDLLDGLPAELAASFAITHFFNPPRRMPLVEVVASPTMPAARFQQLRGNLETQLGKTVVECRDTPGFIANRIGNFWVSVGVDAAIRRRLDIENADASGKGLGIPSTGIFGLFDLVGIALTPAIWGSLLAALPATDEFHRYNVPELPVFRWLLANGFTGRSSSGGFYRGRDQALDLAALEYRPRISELDPVATARTPLEAVAGDSPGSLFAWEVYSATLVYACQHAAEISETIADIDAAMEQGYAWKSGPFRIADEISVDYIISRLEQENREVPTLLTTAKTAGGFYPTPGHTLTSTGIPHAMSTPPDPLAGAVTIMHDDGILLRQLSNGIGVLTLTTRGQTLSASALDSLTRLATQPESCGLTALVIASSNPRVFSAGADLNRLAKLAETGDLADLDADMQRGTQAMTALASCRVPVVAAVVGAALGGGAEMLLHCHRIVAHSESRIGFPERFVGLIPGWNGTVETLRRVGDPQSAFDFIMTGKPTDSAFLARSLGLLRAEDEILSNAHDVLPRALEVASALIGHDTRLPDGDLTLYSPSAPPLNAAWQSEEVSPADRRIAAALAGVYTSAGAEVETLSTVSLGLREGAAANELLTHGENRRRAEHMALFRRPLKD